MGALAGYAAGYAFDSYRVSQKKSAAEVNDEYKKEHDGELPAETMVTKYVTKTDPSGLVNRGSQLDIVSEIELVKGEKTAGQTDRVDEELLISDASGKNTKRLKAGAQRCQYIGCVRHPVYFQAYPGSCAGNLSLQDGTLSQ